MPRRPTLVLADDHPLMVEGLRSMLQPRFDIVATANTGAELLVLLQTLSPDGLLLDLSLPDQNGLELLPHITHLRPKLRILIVTMHLDRVLADAAFRAGAHGFIPKDSGIDELEIAVQAILDGRRYVSPRVPKHSHRMNLAARHLGLSRLTERQQEILRLIGDGKTTPQIAEILGLSERTVSFHRGNIRRILGIDSEWGLVRYAIMIEVGEDSAD